MSNDISTVIVNKNKPKKQSQLQQIKTVMRSAYNTSSRDLPTSFEELKKLKNRDLALKFQNEFISGRVKTKTEFCNANKVSHNTLNKGLKTLFWKSAKKSDRKKPLGTEIDQMERNETEINDNINNNSKLKDNNIKVIDTSDNKNKIKKRGGNNNLVDDVTNNFNSFTPFGTKVNNSNSNNLREEQIRELNKNSLDD